MSSQSPSSPGKEYRELPRMGPYDPIPEVSPAAGDSVNELYNSINRTFPGAVTNFEARWKAWKETWFSDKFSSNAANNCEAPEYFELVLLGPKIIPLVVYKLASSSKNFRGVFLYNELEQDRDYLVDPKDILNYNVLQRQSNLIVEMNRERNNIVRARIEAWKAHCTRMRRHNNPIMFTGCDEYAKLVELGDGIIAHVMLAYSEDLYGFWYELLYEAVHGPGKKSGLGSYVPLEHYAVWDEWFQNEEHFQIPRWDNGERVITERPLADGL